SNFQNKNPSTSYNNYGNKSFQNNSSNTNFNSNTNSNPQFRKNISKNQVPAIKSPNSKVLFCDFCKMNNHNINNCRKVNSNLLQVRKHKDKRNQNFPKNLNSDSSININNENNYDNTNESLLMYFRKL